MLARLKLLIYYVHTKPVMIMVATLDFLTSLHSYNCCDIEIKGIKNKTANIIKVRLHKYVHTHTLATYLYILTS